MSDVFALERGVYSIPQASRLLGVSDGRLRSWMDGRKVKSKTGHRIIPALWTPSIPKIDGVIALCFLDLMELRLVKRLLDYERMGLPRIREAITNYRSAGEGHYPLLNKKLMTDGEYLYKASHHHDEKPLLNLNKWQFVFDAVVAPTLHTIEYGSNELPARWWPKGREAKVLVDPEISFGSPCVDEIPTVALAKAHSVEGSLGAVVRLYGVSEDSVRHAIEFEADLAARRLVA